MNIVYKVVTEDFVSFIAYDTKFAMEYKINKKATARIGKLFVFKRLEDIKGFAGDHKHCILECETKEEPQEIEKVLDVSYISDEERMKNFWGKDRYESYLDVAPHGSFLVKSLIPRRVVSLKPPVIN